MKFSLLFFIFFTNYIFCQPNLNINFDDLKFTKYKSNYFANGLINYQGNCTMLEGVDLYCLFTDHKRPDYDDFVYYYHRLYKIQCNGTEIDMNINFQYNNFGCGFKCGFKRICSNVIEPKYENKNKMSVGSIIGIVFGVLLVLVIITAIVVIFCRKKVDDEDHPEKENLISSDNNTEVNNQYQSLNENENGFNNGNLDISIHQQV